jgi:hypothetical protein
MSLDVKIIASLNLMKTKNYSERPAQFYFCYKFILDKLSGFSVTVLTLFYNKIQNKYPTTPKRVDFFL